MKRFISYLLMTFAVSFSFLFFTATDLHASPLSDSLRATISCPHFQEDSDSVASIVVTAEGDTLYIYGKKKYDFGAIVNYLQRPVTDDKQLLRTVASISNAAQAPPHRQRNMPWGAFLSRKVSARRAQGSIPSHCRQSLWFLCRPSWRLIITASRATALPAMDGICPVSPASC